MNSDSNPSFSMEDFAQALEQGQYDYNFNRGQIINGIVSQHDSKGAYVDIGGKSPAFIPLDEIPCQETELPEVLPLQEEFKFLIIKEQNAEGQVTVSLRQLQIKKAWEKVQDLAETNQSVEVVVTGVNKGGVTVDVEGLRAFIPRSHLIQRDKLESLVGQYLRANFLQVEPNINKLILSQRQIARNQAMSKLEAGSLVDGKVVKIEGYGVFVNLEGVTGLLHIRQISNKRVDSLNALFEIGKEIKVMIAEIDDVKNRISLSTKVLESYPGEILDKFDEVMNTAEERVEKAKKKLTEDSSSN